MFRRFLCGLLSLLLLGLPQASRGASDLPSPQLLIEKTALTVSAQTGQILQNNYNAMTALVIDWPSLISPAISENIFNELAAKVPEIKHIDRTLLDRFILRTVVAFKLAKGGFEGAMEKELIYLASDFGEIADFIRRSVKDKALAELHIEDVILTVNRVQVEHLPPLRAAEKARLLKLMAKASDHWGSDENLKTARDLSRHAEILRSRLFHGAAAAVIFIFYVLIVSDTSDLGIDFQQTFLSVMLATEVAVIHRAFRKGRAHRSPWRAVSFQSARNACLKTMANLQELAHL